MLVETDAADIKVEVRCGECNQSMHIYEQYEHDNVLVVEVSICDECKNES